MRIIVGVSPHVVTVLQVKPPLNQFGHEEVTYESINIASESYKM